MYSRSYAGKTHTFEPSGGLIQGALVFQDDETLTYWGLMQGKALAGPVAGTRLVELPVGHKLQWKDWVAQHPTTLVLSIQGREDVAFNPYTRYFGSKGGFRGLRATDGRLATKAPIYAVQLGARKIAIPFTAFVGGGVVSLGKDGWAFLYRPAGVSIFHGTIAFQSKARFRKSGTAWSVGGARFDPVRGAWSGKASPKRLQGFDTFWYSWSLANPKTEVLGAAVAKPSAPKAPKPTKRTWFSDPPR